MSEVAQTAVAPPATDTTWEIVPQGLLSRHFQLKRDGEVVSTLRMALFREQCHFELAGHSFVIRRPSLWKDAFQLIAGSEDGQSVCDVKRNFWSRQFVLASAEQRWVLRPAGFFTRTQVLLVGTREVGSIRPAGWLARRRLAKFSEEMPPPIQVLAIFLVLIVSRRQNQSSGG